MMDRRDVFNVGRATQWDFADGLGFNSKSNPKTIDFAILILRQVEVHQFAKVPLEVLIDRELGGHCTHG